VSDITYIRTGEGFYFLSLVTDAYTHEIIGWKVGKILEAIHTLDALKMACRDKLKGEPARELIHHSDRGTQYAGLLYTDYLKSYDIQISMTQSGNPKDNAIAERVNGILKREFLDFETFETITQVDVRMDEVVCFYNNKRIHRSLNMMTPTQATTLNGPIRKKWKCYKDKYRYACRQGQTIVHLP
jgi:transposase InsO family protein